MKFGPAPLSAKVSLNSRDHPITVTRLADGAQLTIPAGQTNVFYSDIEADLPAVRQGQNFRTADGVTVSLPAKATVGMTPIDDNTLRLTVRFKPSAGDEE